MTVAATTPVAIGLGANLGDTRATLAVAFEALAGLPLSSGLRRSPLYRSAPIDSTGPDYLNAVALLDTALAPHDLLRHLQAIENDHGRVRPYVNAPRTLDLDLLLYGDQTLRDATLVIPHPRLHLRAFVLRPLADLAPDWIVPGLGAVADLLAGVADQQADKLVR